MRFIFWTKQRTSLGLLSYTLWKNAGYEPNFIAKFYDNYTVSQYDDDDDDDERICFNVT